MHVWVVRIRHVYQRGFKFGENLNLAMFWRFAKPTVARKGQFYLQSTIHNPQSTIHNLHCAMCDRQSTIHNPHCATCDRQSTIHIVQRAIDNLQSTLCNVRLTIYNPHCAMCDRQSTLYKVRSRIDDPRCVSGNACTVTAPKVNQWWLSSNCTCSSESKQKIKFCNQRKLILQA